MSSFSTNFKLSPITAKKFKNCLISPNRKVILNRKQRFNTMMEYNVPIYNNRIHYADACVIISHNAVKKRDKLINLEYLSFPPRSLMDPIESTQTTFTRYLPSHGLGDSTVKHLSGKFKS